MASSAGTFVWHELMTTEPEAARQFYGAVMGWTEKESGVPGYTVLGIGQQGVAGVMGLPPEAQEAGAQPRWVGYVSVDDVAAASERLKAAGGTIHRGPDGIPGVGHFAAAADPQGALFVLFQPDRASPPPAPGATPGLVGWNELHAADWTSAFDFYAGQFGWTKDTAVDMGPMGTYQLFAVGGVALGGMMTAPPGSPQHGWLYYFNVEAIDAGIERVKAAGGQLLNGPHPVPGGSLIAQCRDPQGAPFALVSPAA